MTFKMNLMIKCFVTFGILIFWNFNELKAQDLDGFFKEQGVETLSRLAHPTNIFQGGTYQMFNDFVIVNINYKNYSTSLKVIKNGKIFTDIEVVSDNDIIEPFLAIKTLKDIIIRLIQEKNERKAIIGSFEEFFNKAMQDMSGVEMACIILSIESLGSNLKEEQIGFYNNEKDGFSAAFDKEDINDNRYKDGDVISVPSLEVDNFEEIKNFQSDNQVISDPSKGIFKDLVTNYYQYLSIEDWDKLGTMYADKLNRYYDKYNFDKQDVLLSAKKYKSQFNILKTSYNIRWQTLKIITLSKTNIITYTMDYNIEKADKKMLNFVLEVVIETNEDMKITSIYENKL
jgi:hypothetical protein